MQQPTDLSFSTLLLQNSSWLWEPHGVNPDSTEFPREQWNRATKQDGGGGGQKIHRTETKEKRGRKWARKRRDSSNSAREHGKRGAHHWCTTQGRNSAPKRKGTSAVEKPWNIECCTLSKTPTITCTSGVKEEPACKTGTHDTRYCGDTNMNCTGRHCDLTIYFSFSLGSHNALMCFDHETENFIKSQPPLEATNSPIFLIPKTELLIKSFA